MHAYEFAAIVFFFFADSDPDTKQIPSNDVSPQWNRVRDDSRVCTNLLQTQLNVYSWDGIKFSTTVTEGNHYWRFKLDKVHVAFDGRPEHSTFTALRTIFHSLIKYRNAFFYSIVKFCFFLPVIIIAIFFLLEVWRSYGKSNYAFVGSEYERQAKQRKIKLFLFIIL